MHFKGCSSKRVHSGGYCNIKYGEGLLNYLELHNIFFGLIADPYGASLFCFWLKKELYFCFAIFSKYFSHIFITNIAYVLLFHVCSVLKMLLPCFCHHCTVKLTSPHLVYDLAHLVKPHIIMCCSVMESVFKMYSTAGGGRGFKSGFGKHIGFV